MKGRKGFTLIELVVSIAIVSILVAVAIPIYKRYEYMARTSEAKQNVGAIMTCEGSYAAVEDKYLTERYYPGHAGATPQVWNPSESGNYEVIGFQPSGKVFYDYGVAAGDFSSNPASANPSHGETPITSGVDITIIARGDLDGDGRYSYLFTTDTYYPKINQKGSEF